MLEELVKLIIYFIIYSLFGWILESVVKTVAQRRPINSGFLYGPFCPIYGIGAIIMFLFLHNFKDKPVILFFIGFVVLSIWEYLVGWLLEKLFHTKYWDYSENKFNIHGRVCLTNSIFWGILGVIFTLYVHPILENKINEIPQIILNIVVVPFVILIVTDFVISVVKVNSINVKLNNLSKISEELKQKLEEVKELAKTSGNKTHLNHVIEELKESQKELKEKLEKQTARLRKAFPTMKSEKISEFFNEKIERIKKK